jgi:multiple sugar transport system permease protein
MQRLNHWGYWLTLPFVIGFLVLHAFPFVFSFFLTFTEWDMFNPPKWIGVSNWNAILHNTPFWYSIRNTLYFAVIFVPLQTIVALIVAHFLNQSIRAKTLFRVIYYLPVVTPWMAAGLIWTWLFQPKAGLLNWLFELIHLGPFDYISSKYWWITIGCIAIVNVWKGIGSSMIILLAGLQNVSKEMYEAAEIDGASKWNLFWKIVFPLVSPMIFMVLILSTIAAFHAFDVFIAMLDVGGVADRNLVTNIMIYRDAFIRYKMGSASTVAWLLFVLIFLVTLGQRYFEKKWVHYE